MKALDINTYDYTPIGNTGYGYVSYNDINLVVSEDKQWFCVTRLIKDIKSAKNKSVAQVTSGPWTHIKDAFPNKFKPVEVNMKRWSSHGGIYARIELLQSIVTAVEPAIGNLWYFGEPWREIDTYGYVYLVKPPNHLEDDIYKIGRSNQKDFDRFNDTHYYGPGTHIYGICMVTKASKAEALLKLWFISHGAIETEFGSEFFKIASLEEATELFKNADLKNLVNNKEYENPILTYKEGKWIYKNNVPKKLPLKKQHSGSLYYWDFDN